MKKFLKNLPEFTLNCKSLHTGIKLKHTQHEWCEKLDRNPDLRIVITIYVCMHLCK